jgi:cytochrome c oxidase subunit 3
MTFPSPRPSALAREPSFQMSAPRLGMLVFLVSLSVVFAGTIVAYAVTRANNPQWKTLALSLPTLGLALSTLTLAAVSLAGHVGRASLRKNRPERASLWLGASLLFAIAFLLLQAKNWATLTASLADEHTASLQAFTYFMLTGLHALHVAGGLVPLAVTMIKASRKEYSSSQHEGASLCLWYWDFLGAVWLVLLVALWWGS